MNHSETNLLLLTILQPLESTKTTQTTTATNCDILRTT